MDDRQLVRGSNWLLSASDKKFAIILSLLAVGRTGVNFYSSGMLEIAEAFPRPFPSYKGQSIVGPALASLLGITSSVAWFALHTLLTALLFLAIFLWSNRRFAQIEARLFCIALLGSSFAVAALGNIGHYDLWMLASALLLGIGKGPGSALLAGILGGATSFEQFIISIVSLLFVMLALKTHDLRRLLSAFVGAAIVRTAIEIWFRQAGFQFESRQDLFFANASQAVENFLELWPLHVFSWYSASWILIAWLLTSRWFTSVQRILLALGLVLIPMSATITTLDGTRVFVAVSSPAFVWVLVQLACRGTPPRSVNLVTMSQKLLGIMVLTPGFLFWAEGGVQSPWGQLLSRVSNLFGFNK